MTIAQLIAERRARIEAFQTTHATTSVHDSIEQHRFSMGLRLRSYQRDNVKALGIAERLDLCVVTSLRCAPSQRDGTRCCKSQGRRHPPATTISAPPSAS